MVRTVTYSLLTLMAAIVCHAADTMTGVMQPRFASLQVYAGDSPLQDPVIMLGEGDGVLTIEFDEIADEVRYMRYSLTHCDAAWQPSGLVYSEYLEGFNEGTVDEWEFSRATTVHYIHYTIHLPNAGMRMTLSGNYLLQVYDEADPDDILLQARFMVTEQAVDIAASVTSHTDVDYNDRHQQLSLAIDPSRLRVHDPFNDFKVVVTQNGRPGDARTLDHPLRMQGRLMVYEHLPELIFPGGNEYRRFENTSTRVPGMRVDEVSYHGPYYHAWVTVDEPRAGTPYLYDSTQHGRYMIREYNSTRSDTEADYVMTHFTLAADPLPDADVYLDGDFVYRRLDDRARMEYNPANRAYETSMMLKQGAYNYRYLVVPRGTRRGLTAPIEGDYYNTVNEYTVAVYYRLPGDRYDRLAGYQSLLSQ